MSSKFGFDVSAESVHVLSLIVLYLWNHECATPSRNISKLMILRLSCQLLAMRSLIAVEKGGR